MPFDKYFASQPIRRRHGKGRDRTARKAAIREQLKPVVGPKVGLAMRRPGCVWWCFTEIAAVEQEEELRLWREINPEYEFRVDAGGATVSIEA